MSTPAPRQPGTLRIGSISGIDVLVAPSSLVFVLLASFVLAPWIESELPDLDDLKYVVGGAFAVIFYLSITLHEASHAVLAKRFGYTVVSISLHGMGGTTEVDGAIREPRHEFWTALAGPVTSLAIGAVGLVLSGVLVDGPIGLLLDGLAWANLALGVLNLVPGLPLDGGRVLAAAIWWTSGNQHRATIAAGWGGRLAALALLAWPVLQGPLTGVEPSIFDLALVFVLGLVLWTGATSAMAHARVRQRLPLLVARPLARRTLTVPEDLPLAEAVRRAQEAQAGSIVTVAPDGTPLGIVSEAAVTATPPERRPWVTVSAVARSMEEGLTLPATVAGEELIAAISRRPAEEYLLVEDDGRIYGVLSTADVDRAFRANAAG